MPKLTPKIILEGTRLTRTTGLALNEHLRIVGPKKYPYHSPIISAEWCAFTNHPWGGGLINFDHSEVHHTVETQNTLLRLFELKRYYSWIIDRLLLSTMLHQRKFYGRHYDLRRIEERLHHVGFHLEFCYRPQESFLRAKEERLQVRGKPEQYDNMNLFIDEQRIFREFVEE